MEYEEILDDQPLDEEDKELLETIYDRLDIFQQMKIFMSVCTANIKVIR